MGMTRTLWSWFDSVPLPFGCGPEKWPPPPPNPHPPNPSSGSPGLSKVPAFWVWSRSEYSLIKLLCCLKCVLQQNLSDRQRVTNIDSTWRHPQIELTRGCLSSCWSLWTLIVLIACMPGGVVVGDSGLCCCVPVQCVTSIVRTQLLPIVCWVYRSALNLILLSNYV